MARKKKLAWKLTGKYTAAGQRAIVRKKKREVRQQAADKAGMSSSWKDWR